MRFIALVSAALILALATGIAYAQGISIGPATVTYHVQMPIPATGLSGVQLQAFVEGGADVRCDSIGQAVEDCAESQAATFSVADASSSWQAGGGMATIARFPVRGECGRDYPMTIRLISADDDDGNALPVGNHFSTVLRLC